jgi:hypothetical protein
MEDKNRNLDAIEASVATKRRRAVIQRERRSARDSLGLRTATSGVADGILGHADEVIP